LSIEHPAQDGRYIDYGKYKEAKRARLIKTVIPAIAVIGIGTIVRLKTAETHAPVWVAAGWLLSAWVLLRLAMALRRGYANFRAHAAAGGRRDLIGVAENMEKQAMASMPSWARGYSQVEKRVYRETWRAMTGKPLEPAGDFSVAGGPNGRLRSALLLVLALVGGATACVVLPRLATAFWPHLFAYAGSGFAMLYALIWIVGERRSLAEGGHRLTRDELILDLGIRGGAAVPLARIAACRVLEPGGHASSVSEVWTLSPGERPNVLIELTGMTPLAVTTFG
jgi:hypothetical protein